MFPYHYIVTAGILAAVLMIHPALTKQRGSKIITPGVSVIDSAISCTLAGLTGSRLFFVLFHWHYYRAFTAEIPQIWLGGMDWAGAVIGVLAGAGLHAHFGKTSFLLILDRLALPSLVVAFSHAIGCALNECMPGKESGLFAFIPPTSDFLGISADRWPSPFLMALALAAAAFFIQTFYSSIRGLKAALTLSLLAAVQLLISFTLSSPALQAAGIRLDALEATAVLIAGLSGIAILSTSGRSKQ
jgi:prolipoprotein diacylglyceryltransferase